MKELFIELHDKLTEEYMEEHPESTFSEAQDKTADKASRMMADALADRADFARDGRDR